MDRLIAPDTVAVGAGDRAPLTGTPGQATDGNAATGFIPTVFPAYGWNMLSEEMIAVVEESGLVRDGADWTQLLRAIKLLIDNRGHGFQAFTTGTYTWMVPARTYFVRVKVWGGGGAGGNTQNNGTAGSGGGAGGYAEGIVNVTPGQQIQVAVGGAGPVANGLAQGGAGGTSAFGTFLAATGGMGGYPTSSSGQNTVPAGGAGVGGQLTLPGAGGGVGLVLGGTGVGGQGGYTYGSSAVFGSGTGATPGGGGGGGNNGNPGGGGGAGLILLEY